MEDLVFFSNATSKIGVVADVVEDFVFVEACSISSSFGVVRFVLIGHGFCVDAQGRCCSRAIVAVGIISLVISAIAVAPAVGIRVSSFLDFCIERCVELFADTLAGKSLDEKVFADVGGEDDRPSGLGSVLIDESSGSGDGQSGD